MAASGGTAAGARGGALRVLLIAWFREVLRQPAHSLLSVAGVAVGVAAVVAVSIANHSARSSFLAAADALIDSTTHVITGAVTDDLYRRLKLETPYAALPVVQGRVRVVGERDSSVTLYGFDPVAKIEFDARAQGTPLVVDDVEALLEDPYSAFASTGTMHALGAQLGDAVEIESSVGRFSIRLAGLLDADTELQKQSVESLLLTDIAMAQVVFGKRGRLSSIHLNLDSAAEADAVERMLPAGVWLEGKSNMQRTMNAVTDAFQTNLTALALLALLVAVFLVYSTMTYLVARRRHRIGVLRSFGVTRGEVVACLAAETLCVGAIASTLGVLAGVELAGFLLAHVERSISNLYFPINADVVIVSPVTIAVAVGLGLSATLFSALPSLSAASSIVPSMSSAHLRQPQRQRRRSAAVQVFACIGFVVTGFVVMRADLRGIAHGFAGMFLVMAGGLCVLPMLAALAGRFLRAVSKRWFGVRGLLASRAFTVERGQTSVALCALSLAVSATVGVDVMIDSFRAAVDQWLEDRLSGDVYVTTSSRYGDVLDAEDIDRLRRLSGVGHVGVANWESVRGENGLIRVFAVDYGEEAFEGFRFLDAAPKSLWDGFQSGGVIVSEPFSWKNQVKAGDELVMFSGGRRLGFPVLGVYYDYSSDRGVVAMHRDQYIRDFGDHDITAAALYAAEGADLSRLADDARNAVASPGATVWNSGALHAASMEIFDQTFAVTAVLRALAVLVAVAAVSSVLAMMQMNRERELRIQRSLGFTARQIWLSASAESGALGLISGALALPLGAVMAWLLIWVINKRSFGWTMQMRIDPAVAAEAIALAVISALIAGLLPAWRLANKTLAQTA